MAIHYRVGAYPVIGYIVSKKEPIIGNTYKVVENGLDIFDMYSDKQDLTIWEVQGKVVKDEGQGLFLRIDNCRFEQFRQGRRTAKDAVGIGHPNNVGKAIGDAEQFIQLTLQHIDEEEYHEAYSAWNEVIEKTTTAQQLLENLAEKIENITLNNKSEQNITKQYFELQKKLTAHQKKVKYYQEEEQIYRYWSQS